MGKGSAKQEVNEYSMSIHLGLGHGPFDAVTGLFVGEKLAWTGEVTGEAGVYINSPSLFGGPKDEGGIGGVMYYLPGGPQQVMPAALANRLGLTSNTCPAFRGIGSVFFIGTDGAEAGSLSTGGSAPPGGDTGDDPYPVGGDEGTGGGGGYGGPRCVWADAWMPDGRQAGALVEGDTITALNYATMAGVVDVQVQHAVPLASVSCVTLVTFSGIRKTVSKDTPFTKHDGRQVPVMDCMDEMCAVKDDEGFRWERIVGVLEAGYRDVVLVDAGGATFAAGDEQGRYLFTHNKVAQQPDF